MKPFQLPTEAGLRESIGDAVRFVPVEGGNHHLRNVDRDAVIKEITAWLISQDEESEGV